MKRTPAWVDLLQFFPDKRYEKDRWSVEHFTVTEKDVEWMQMRDAIKRSREYSGFKAGEYIRLKDPYGDTVMSDTWMEKATNWPFVESASGHVLIAGLGLGMVLLPVQAKHEVKSVTVIEKYQPVIDLVASRLPLKSTTRIIRGDILNTVTWGEEIANQKFDTIYFDIWTNIPNDDDKDDLRKLWRMYKSRLKSKGRMSAWRVRIAGLRTAA